MGQSHSIPVEHARLIFSTNSLRNSSLQCDALGLHYQLSTPMDGLIKNERTTTITRWDPHQGKDVVLAEWRRKQVGSNRIRLHFERPLVGEVPGSVSDDGNEDGFIPVKQFFPRTSGFWGGVNFKRTFTTGEGRSYTWRSRDWSLKLYEEGSDLPIAEYIDKRFFMNKGNAYLRLAPGCEQILDYIVVTCIIAERKRRDAKKRQRASSGGGGS